MSAAEMSQAVNNPTETPDWSQVLDLSHAIEDQLRLLYAMLDEVTADTDVRSAALHIACEAGHLWSATQKLAQVTGVHSAADLEARVESGVRMLEPLLVAMSTLMETLPEVLGDLAKSGTMQQLGMATVEWTDILKRITCLIQGASPSLTARVSGLVDDASRWSGELVVAWETLAATLPEVMQDEMLHKNLNDLQKAIGVWASVAIEARTMVARCGGGNMASGARALVCSIRDGLDDAEQKGGSSSGGIFALIRLVLSGKTIYVLRNVISIAYRVLKTMNASGKKKTAG
ncbi:MULTISPECIES: hypothetical protein [Acidithiobacillus]|jgi:hypothetical protein|uniref:hypothetical protein n=1 Tax=Acidithiobacillus TaxID=119977 RepID=UPI001C07C9DF|nr:hypothetical protein [Acidithiobacillus thiooxidans]MBU2841840.1 hypothetical protein [Acidithiobacillus thiooxidans]